MQIVPLDNSPNQNFDISLNINGKNQLLNLAFSYNSGNYWAMSVSKNDTTIVSNIPLLYGDNLLRGLEYLEIGSAYLYKLSDTSSEIPDDKNLGSEFILIWGDN